MRCLILLHPFTQSLFIPEYLNKNSKGNLITLKHYVYSVSNFRPLGLYQETNNWINAVNYISIVLANQ